MAKQTVFVPDGLFCSDHGHLGCIYEHHQSGLHHCTLFLEDIHMETFTVNGEKQRAFKKCNACTEKITNDAGKGILPD